MRVRMDREIADGEAASAASRICSSISRFRGSVHVPDSRSSVWQRLVTFGSDSNATTTFTATTYKLDLPMATPAGLDESFKIPSRQQLSGPRITQAILGSERPVVLAEQREQPRPQVRLQDAARPQLRRPATRPARADQHHRRRAAGGNAEAVEAFRQRRWYRPERAVVIVVGDLDPALLEQMVVKHFTDWKGTGPAPVKPRFRQAQRQRPRRRLDRRAGAAAAGDDDHGAAVDGVFGLAVIFNRSAWSISSRSASGEPPARAWRARAAPISPPAPIFRRASPVRPT